MMRPRGFSLMELLLVMALIGVASLLAVAAMTWWLGRHWAFRRRREELL